MKTARSERRNAMPRRIERSPSAEHPILFGTSGWRGRLGEEVTFPRLRVLVRSVADWILEQEQGNRVLIGWDNRFASGDMARTAAAILAEMGLEPHLSRTAVPTPAVTSALATRRCAAGLVLTASHNPARDHGLKVFTAWGGTISDEAARRIEILGAGRMHDDAPARAIAPLRREDLLDPYRALLSSVLDEDAIRSSGLSVVYDAMNGSGAGVLDTVLESAGATVERLRCFADPHFGGGMPDPSVERLTDLSDRIRDQTGLGIGLASDGDGDRFGAVDGSGRLLSETQVVALLIDQLAREGRIQKGVALSIGTGSLAVKVAESHGLHVERHPVGFKHLSASLHSGRTDLAGEESGGFAWAPFGFDKDGLLAGCLLVNLVARSLEPLEFHVRRLEEQFGVSACGRTAIARRPAIDRAIERLTAAPPERIGRVGVSEVDCERGLCFGLADGGFLILRASGTEPLLRIYAEASCEKDLESRLKAGIGLVERLARES